MEKKWKFWPKNVISKQQQPNKIEDLNPRKTNPKFKQESLSQKNNNSFKCHHQVEWKVQPDVEVEQDVERRRRGPSPHFFMANKNFLTLKALIAVIFLLIGLQYLSLLQVSEKRRGNFRNNQFFIYNLSSYC